MDQSSITEPNKNKPKKKSLHISIGWNNKEMVQHQQLNYSHHHHAVQNSKLCVTNVYSNTHCPVPACFPSSTISPLAMFVFRLQQSHPLPVLFFPHPLPVLCFPHPLPVLFFSPLASIVFLIPCQYCFPHPLPVLFSSPLASIVFS